MTWDYTDFMEFENDPQLDNSSHPLLGIHLNFSKGLNCYFINNVTSEPADSHGFEWVSKQSCITLTAFELNSLIERLQRMLKETQSAKTLYDTL